MAEYGITQDSNGNRITCNYDSSKRLTSLTRTTSGDTAETVATLLAESKRTKKADGSTVSEYTYTYDALGNITAISGSTNAAYTYDNQSQLLSETLEGITTCYTYDSVGNIRSVSEGGTTHTCTYGDAEWKDLLTAYDGHPITYDAIGNPLQWHDGRSFTWTDGRRLASSTGNGNVISYTYNADGLRLTKNVNGTEHRYTWQGSRLINEYRAGNTLEFFYDESGRPAAFSHNGAAYYYVTNLQGDITHILDANGNVCAEYSYNAWGRILSAIGTMAAVNPLRYRGYYYDAESGWYYLKSRYYAPEICRWISADEAENLGTEETIPSYNLFSYCINNPINRFDNEGTFSIPNWVKITVGTVALVGAVALTVATGGGAAAVAVGVVKIIGSIAISTAVGAGLGYLSNGKQGAIDGACDGYMFGSVASVGSATVTYLTFPANGINTYKILRQENRGSGNQVHHIVEKRFAKSLGINNTNEMLSVALSKSKHQQYTNAWRNNLPYRGSYSKKQILGATVRIYAKSPRLLFSAIKTLF